jgi:hypothetical protein
MSAKNLASSLSGSKFSSQEETMTFDDVIIVSLSNEMNCVYYSANFYYKEPVLALSVDERMEEKIGCSIEDWKGYDALMSYIMIKVVPYSELITRIDDFNPGIYGLNNRDIQTPD